MFYSDPIFQESRVLGYEPIVKQWRDSFTAFLNEAPEEPETPQERIVHCIEERASRFQGHVPINTLESLQVVKYSSLFIRLNFTGIPTLNIFVSMWTG